MTLIWPFTTKDPGQWRRIDQGQDLQGAGPSEEAVLAIADGVISYAHDPGGGGAHFGDPYPVLTFRVPQGGQPACYYGHTFPAVAEGASVHQGDVIAHTGNPGGGGAPAHWLELGWWNGGPTGNGQAMHDALLDAPIWEDNMPLTADDLSKITLIVQEQTDAAILRATQGPTGPLFTLLGNFWNHQFRPWLKAIADKLGATDPNV